MSAAPEPAPPSRPPDLGESLSGALLTAHPWMDRAVVMGFAALTGLVAADITRETIPEDVRDERIHRAWRFTKSGGR